MIRFMPARVETLTSIPPPFVPFQSPLRPHKEPALPFKRCDALKQTQRGTSRTESKLGKPVKEPELFATRLQMSQSTHL